MDLAARITKLAYRKAFGRLSEGMTPRDLAGLIGEAHAAMGARGGGPQFGPGTSFPTARGRRGH